MSPTRSGAEFQGQTYKFFFIKTWIFILSGIKIISSVTSVQLSSGQVATKWVTMDPWTTQVWIVCGSTYTWIFYPWMWRVNLNCTGISEWVDSPILELFKGSIVYFFYYKSQWSWFCFPPKAYFPPLLRLNYNKGYNWYKCSVPIFNHSQQLQGFCHIYR